MQTSPSPGRFHHPKVKLCTIKQYPPNPLSSQPLVNMNLLSVPINSTTLITCVCRITWYLSFYVGHISLSIMFSRFIMLQYNQEFPSFLRLHNIPLYVYATFCKHTSVDGHLSWFLAIMNNATINTGVQRYVPVSNSLGVYS